MFTRNARSKIKSYLACPLKETWQSDLFFDFLYINQFSIQPFKPFRVWLRIRGDARNQKSTPRLSVLREIDNSSHRKGGVTYLLPFSDTGSRYLMKILIYSVRSA
jgi:hypothetical protein